MSSVQGGSSAGADSADSQAPIRDDIVVGKIASPFGVRGWTKVVSYTEPEIGILGYTNWILKSGKRTHPVEVEQGREHGKFLVVKLAGVEEREQAALLTNAEIVVEREQFPEVDDGEYYWADLIGLTVVTMEGVDLGVIERMLETGANDVMVVNGDRERLVPWVTPDVVTEVDLQQRRLTVNWDPDF